LLGNRPDHMILTAGAATNVWFARRQVSPIRLLSAQGSASLGILGGWTNPGTHDAQRVFWRGRLEMTAERVRWWNGAISVRHFPYDGGRFRQERAYFGVVTSDGGMRQIEGSSPDNLRRDLAEVCASFNGGIERLGKQNATVLEQTRVAGAVYAGILRVHPFADGNHRTGFVALAAALWSLGLPAVEFAQDADMTDHDEAVAPAPFSPDGDIEPFARLLATRIEHARKPAT
jgi:hypothetical protein